MSRAFVKEGDGTLDPLPDLPQSANPNYVTPRGQASLQSRLQSRQAELIALRHRAERLDRLPEAAAERDIRYLEGRLRSAIVIDPRALPLTEVAFGLCVTVVDADGRQSRYEITGQDEADAQLFRIAPQSPLARGLIGAAVGEEVVWRKPSGDVVLEVMKIEHADS